MLLIRSPWDHPPIPGGVRARYTAGKLLLGSAREVGTFWLNEILNFDHSLDLKILVGYSNTHGT